VAYIDVSAGWVSSKTAGYLIWTEAPQLLACSTRASQERFHFLLTSIAYFCIHMYISPSLQSTTRVTRPLKSQVIDPQDLLCRVIYSFMALYQLQIAGVAHSVEYSVIDWKNRLLFPAVNDFGLGKKKWLQHAADAHLHPVLCIRMLGALPPFFLNAFIAWKWGKFTFTCLTVQWHTCVRMNYYNLFLRTP
jgi:hypothetical protein